MSKNPLLFCTIYFSYSGGDFNEPPRSAYSTHDSPAPNLLVMAD